MRYVLTAALLYGLCLFVASPASASTAVVGDSLAAGTAPYLSGVDRCAFPGVGSDWAIAQLKRIDRPSVDAIVFDAGTNDAKLDTLGRSLWELLKVAHGRRVVLLTTSGYIGDTPSAVRRLEARKNRMIRRLAGGNVRVIRWRRIALALGLLADGVHATDAGYLARADLIRGALQ